MMPQKFSPAQDLVQNQAFASRPTGAKGQIGGTEALPDSSISLAATGTAHFSQHGTGIAPALLAAVEDIRWRELFAQARQALSPETLAELGGLLDHPDAYDPERRDEVRQSLERLIDTERRIAARIAEQRSDIAEMAELIHAEHEAGRAYRRTVREAYRRHSEAERLETERREAERLAAIRRVAVAQAARDERSRAERRKADKELRRIDAERRAKERAERQRQRLAAWPRKQAFA